MDGEGDGKVIFLPDLDFFFDEFPPLQKGAENIIFFVDHDIPYQNKKKM